MTYDDATLRHATHLAAVLADDLAPDDAPHGPNRYGPTPRMRPDLREVWADVAPRGDDAYGEAAATDDAHTALTIVAGGQPDDLANIDRYAGDVAPEVADAAATYNADALEWITHDAHLHDAGDLLEDAGITDSDPVRLAVTARYLAAYRHVRATLENLLEAADHHLAEYADAVADAAREAIGEGGHALPALGDDATNTLTDAITDDPGRLDLARIAAYHDAHDVGRDIAITYARAAWLDPDRPHEPDAERAIAEATR